MRSDQCVRWRAASWRAVAVALVVATVAGCATMPPAPPIGTPANLGELKTEILAYERSGAYDHDLAAVGAAAQAYVEQRAATVVRPAMVLDIDETSLSNWPEIRANDFGYIPDGPCDHLPRGPCGVKAWEQSARATAIVPTLSLFRAARARGVAVFFVTGRPENERAATERNLHRAGYAGWAGLVLRTGGSATRSAADYKTRARAKIEAAGYTIIANVGDQPSDLAGGHAERTFLLPNPFYRIP